MRFRVVAALLLAGVLVGAVAAVIGGLLVASTPGGWYGYAPRPGTTPPPAVTVTAMPLPPAPSATPTATPLPPAPSATLTATARSTVLSPQAAYLQGLAHLRAERYRRAIDALSLTIRLDPSLVAAYLARGVTWVPYNDHESNAIADFTAVIQLAPASAEAVHAYVLRGGLYDVQGRNAEALADYTAAIRLDPGDAGAYYSRGLVYQGQGDLDRALSDFDQAVAVAPQDATAHYYRGQAYYERGDFDQAIAAFTAAIRHYPHGSDPSGGTARRRVLPDLPPAARFELGEAYYWRGWGHWVHGAYALAIADANEAIRLDDFSSTSGYLLRGAAYVRQGQHDQAIADFTAYLAVAPGDADAYYGRGRAYFGLADFDQAIADFTAAIRLAPDDEDTYFLRGRAYFERGDFDQAIADFTAAIRLYLDYTFAYYYRGLAYFEQGQYDRARLDLLQARQRGYNQADVAAALDRLPD